MKTIVVILFGLFMAAGCSRQSNPPEVRYENLALHWLNENDTTRSMGLTNHCLAIVTVTGTSMSTEYSDVASLDGAADILGQYGWHLVSTESSDMSETWHMERQAREDGKQFSLIDGSASQMKSLEQKLTNGPGGNAVK